MARGEKETPTGFWGNVSPGLKKGLIISAAVVIIGSAGTYITYRIVRRQRSRKVLKNAIHDGTLESLVEKIDIAFEGAGTVEEKVYEAFSDIPTQKIADRVAAYYEAAYGETLDKAMRGDLAEEEIQTVKNILAGKPEMQNGQVNYNLLGDWIRRLNLAKGNWSTDEDAIYRVLWEVPDKNGYTVLSKAITADKNIGYKDLYEFLKGQLDESEQSHAAEIMARKK